MKTARKTRFSDPYKANGRLNLPTCPSCKQSGVYLIKSKRSGKIIYIGHSSTNLYKTITRHFQTWNDKAQQRYVYQKSGYQIRVIFTTPARAALLEKYLIKKMQPRDNKMKYESYLSFPEEKRAEEVYTAAKFIDIGDDIF
jgi:excinuclease UvrABC nuclease subunit